MKLKAKTTALPPSAAAGGMTYQKPAGSGRWWFSFVLKSGKRWAQPVPRARNAAEAEAHLKEVMRQYFSEEK